MMHGYLLSSFYRWLVIHRGLLLISLLLVKCVGNIGSYPNNMNLLSVDGTIYYCILVFVPILDFFIA